MTEGEQDGLSVPAPQSFAQEGMFQLWEAMPEAVPFHILCALRTHPRVSSRLLAACFHKLAERHAILRTVYGRDATGRPIQIVGDTPQIAFSEVDASGWDRQRIDRALTLAADHPFDLRVGPVLRVSLFRGGEIPSVLLLAFHHIAYDLWSLDILLHELEELYAALAASRIPKLPELSTDYASYARWQRDRVDDPESDAQWTFWRRKLSATVPELELPIDHDRPPLPSFGGASHPFPIDDDLFQRVLELARTEATTPFVVLLSAFELLVASLSRQEHFMLGTPAAGRTRRNLERVVGCFINPLVLIADLRGAPSFRHLLGRTRRDVAQALDHQDLPFGLLARRLGRPRRPGRSPLFQAMFVWDRLRLSAAPGASPFAPRGLHGSGARLRGGQLGLVPHAMEQRGAAYDLTLILFDGGSRASAAMVYKRDLFESETVAGMARRFSSLLAECLENPDRPLSLAATSVRWP